MPGLISILFAVLCRCVASLPVQVTHNDTLQSIGPDDTLKSIGPAVITPIIKAVLGEKRIPQFCLDDSRKSRKLNTKNELVEKKEAEAAKKQRLLPLKTVEEMKFELRRIYGCPSETKDKLAEEELASALKYWLAEDDNVTEVVVRSTLEKEHHGAYIKQQQQIEKDEFPVGG
jgi:hypothetical protein